jgi:hypothetical protein
MMVIILILNISPIRVLSAGGSTATKKVEIRDFNGDGIQTFRFFVSATGSSSRYKYKTVGWKAKIKPTGKQTYTGRYDFSFSNVDDNTVDIPLEDLFNCANVPQIDREVGGTIEVDAIQVIMVNGKKTYPEYTEDASNIINGITQRYGIQWSASAKKDLPTYYNNSRNYDPVSEEISVNVNLEVISTDEDHTLDVTKGETNATVNIHATVDVIPSGKGEYAQDYNNLKNINIKLGGKEVDITSFPRLGGEADFTFTYDSSQIDDGIVGNIDKIIKDYKCDAKVDYKLQYHGNGTAATEVELTKITSIENEKQPSALIGYKNGSTVTEEGKKIYLRNNNTSVDVPILDMSKYKDAQVNSIKIKHNNNVIKTTPTKNSTITVNCGMGGHVFEIEFIDSRDNKLYTDRVSFFIDDIKNNPDSKEPVAVIEADTQVRAGDWFILDGSKSRDKDGTIEGYSWYAADSEMQLPNNKNVVTWFKAENTGMKGSMLTVTDNDGLTGKDVHSFEVLPPTVKGDISYNGRLKINRKLTLKSAFDAPLKYPVNTFLWFIQSNANYVPDIYLTDMKKENPMFGSTNESIYFLPRQQGALNVQLFGSNGYYADTISKTYDIQPDLPPIVDFDLPEKEFYRNPYDDLKAEIIINNTSHSPDGDYIKNIKVKYIHDANNDGVFDEPVQLGYDGVYTDKTRFKVNKLGKYKLIMYGTEGFDDTILSLLSEDDYLKANTELKTESECIVEVDNKAPMVAIKALKKEPVSIGIAIDKKSNLTNVQSLIDSVLVPKLDEYNIKPDVKLMPYIKNSPINQFRYAIRYKYKDYGDDDYWEDYEGNANYKASFQTSDGLYVVTRDKWSTEYYINDSYLHSLVTDQLADLCKKGFVDRGDNYEHIMTYVDFRRSDEGYYARDLSITGVTESDNFIISVGLYDLCVDLANNRREKKFNYRVYAIYNPRSRRIELISRSYIGGASTLKDWFGDYTKEYNYSRTLGDHICVEYYLKPDGTVGGCRRSYAPYILDVDFDGSNIYHKFWDDFYSTRIIDFKTIPRPYPNDLIINQPKKMSWDEKYNYFTVFQDLQLKHFHEEELATLGKKYNTDFVALGSESGRPVLENIITKNSGNGIYMEDKGDMTKTFENLAHYIKLDSWEPPVPVSYITIDDEVKIILENLDYERDEIKEQKWVFEHVDANYFENGLGIMADSGVERDTPIEKFEKVGKYLISAKVKDEATKESDLLTYNKWSEDTPSDKKYTLYVHRRPVADFDISVYRDGIIIKDKSYDKDHESELTKGITEWKWSYFDNSIGEWIEGKPEQNKLTNGETYSMKLLVKDIEGAWSKPYIKDFKNSSYKPMPPELLDAKLKANNSKYLLSSIPSSEDLKVYDIITKYNKDHYIDMALYKGSTKAVDSIKMNTGTDDVSVKDETYTWKDKIYSIPKTLTDGIYKFIINAIDTNNINNKDSVEFNVTVNTPINLTSSIPSKVRYDQDSVLTATTSKYANEVKVTLFNNTSYAKTVNMTLDKSIGDTKHWTLTYKETRIIPDGDYVAKFVGTTPNGNSEMNNHNFNYTNNTPPTLKILSTDPSFIYEGDNVKANINISDLDLDTLDLTLELLKDGTSIKTENFIIKPNGSKYDLFTTNLIDNIVTGNYEIRVNVDDRNGGVANDSLDFIVNELSITGKVSHVQKWNENRIKYNKSKGGTSDSPRDYNTYFGGERFVLAADTTIINPLSNVRANHVDVRMLSTSYDTNLASSNNHEWSGSLVHEDMKLKLPSKSYTFRFTVNYSNGVIKTDDVTIKVDGNVFDYFRLHREY